MSEGLEEQGEECHRLRGRQRPRREAHWEDIRAECARGQGGAATVLRARGPWTSPPAGRQSLGHLEASSPGQGAALDTL